MGSADHLKGAAVAWQATVCTQCLPMPSTGLHLSSAHQKVLEDVLTLRVCIECLCFGLRWGLHMAPLAAPPVTAGSMRAWLPCYVSHCGGQWPQQQVHCGDACLLHPSVLLQHHTGNGIRTQAATLESHDFAAQFPA